MSPSIGASNATRLGELERAIMEVLWAGPEPQLTARQVLVRLDGRDLAYMTVKTVLDRLSAKKVVIRQVEPGSRAMLYAPAARREAYIAELMLENLSMAVDRGAVLAQFARAVSPAEADTLRGALRHDSAETESPP